MTLRTITYDTATHKLVPREPTDEMLQAALGDISFFNSEYIAVLKRKYSALVESAPEYCDKSPYQEPEQLCDDGGKCGAGGYCNNCAEPVVKENGKLRERLANQHAGIEQLKTENGVLLKQAERYEKVRKLNAQEFAEIFRMNIREGIPFDEIIDSVCIFTAQDIGKDE